jgi:hypothetical protein
VQAPDELEHHAVKVMRDEIEEAAGGEERERALQRFEKRHRTQSFFQVAVQR